jgi:hypothetical protein
MTSKNKTLFIVFYYPFISLQTSGLSSVHVLCPIQNLKPTTKLCVLFFWFPVRAHQLFGSMGPQNTHSAALELIIISDTQYASLLEESTAGFIMHDNVINTDISAMSEFHTRYRLYTENHSVRRLCDVGSSQHIGLRVYMAIKMLSSPSDN